MYFKQLLDGYNGEKKVKKLLSLATAGLLALAATSASATVINFDVDQADYVAPEAGSHSYVVVTDQFSSLGVLFSDLDYPTLGVVVGSSLYGGSTPNLMYSNNGSGSYDTLTRIAMDFVDPFDSGNNGYVTSISGFWTDAGMGATLTAFDADGNQIGQAATTTSFGAETLALSGIGQISRVEWITSNATGLDDLEFGAVTAYSEPVPEPAMLALFGLGLVGFGVARKRK